MISITKRRRGERLSMSSIVPVYSMIVIAVMMINSDGQPQCALVKPMPSKIPNNTAHPPNTGMGTRCSFLASGLSTTFFAIAIFTTSGCIHITASRDEKNAIRMCCSICLMFCLCLIILLFLKNRWECRRWLLR